MTMTVFCEVCKREVVHMGGFWHHLTGSDHIARPPKGTRIPRYDYTDDTEDIDGPEGENDHAK